MPNIVNLTPYALNIYDEKRLLVATLPPERVPARVTVNREQTGRVLGIPLYQTVYGKVENLPETVPNTIYVVSFMVSNAVPERLDVLSPGELLRDENGQPIGCIGLTK